MGWVRTSALTLRRKAFVCAACLHAATLGLAAHYRPTSPQVRLSPLIVDLVELRRDAEPALEEDLTSEALEPERVEPVVEDVSPAPTPAPAPDPAPSPSLDETVETPDKPSAVVDIAPKEPGAEPGDGEYGPAVAAPYPETPPSPTQRTVRSIFCARLSESQRFNCPPDDVDNALTSTIVAEARAAETIYDPIWDVVRTDTALASFLQRNRNAGVDAELPSHFGIDNSIFQERSDDASSRKGR